MSKRYLDALDIQQGSFHLTEVARLLVNCIDECMSEGLDPATDPAIRLIVHQMGFLASVCEKPTSLLKQSLLHIQ